jgi:hypothetical protein
MKSIIGIILALVLLSVILAAAPIIIFMGGISYIAWFIHKIYIEQIK